MTRYISEPVRSDRPAIRAEMDDALATGIPGLDVPPGALTDVMIDTFASISAQDRELLTEVLAIIMRYSGEKIDRVPQRAAIAASTQSTWVRTVADEAAVGARLVLAGTEVNVRGLDGGPVAFRTTADFTFADGVTSTGAGAVGLAAVVPGIAGNELQDGATSAQTQTWFQSVTLTAPTSGGVDAEGDDEYLDRLADTRPLQLQAIANADDLSRWLRNQPGVYRAMTLDNYDADLAVADAPGHLSGVPMGANGAQLSDDAMSALQLAAQQVTLTNLKIHIVAPTDNVVTVSFVGIAKRGWDPADVETRSEAALLDMLSRVNWGATDGLDPRAWEETLVLLYQDASAVLNGVPGFDRHTALLINGAADDFTLTGPGALPASDPTVTGAVTAP